MANDDWLDEASAKRAAKRRRERELTDQRRRAGPGMDSPAALTTARVFWEAFKVEVRRIITEWNHRSANDRIIEGPQADHMLIVYRRGQMSIFCRMTFSSEPRDKRELSVTYRSGPCGLAPNVRYAITSDDSGIQVGTLRSPESLATEVMKAWLGEM